MSDAPRPGDPRISPKRLQVYETPEITVTFDPNVCIHSGVCLMGLPAVFDVERKRWVRPELVAQVEFSNWTEDRILRHATFQGLREDRPAKSVVRSAADAEERYRLEPAEESSAELIYDRRWARAVLDSVMAKLSEEFSQAGKRERFEPLSRFIFQEPQPGEYSRLAAQWKVTESGVRSSVQRIRERYAALVRAEIANTVSDPRDVDGEVAHLINALGK